MGKIFRLNTTRDWRFRKVVIIEKFCSVPISIPGAPNPWWKPADITEFTKTVVIAEAQDE